MVTNIFYILKIFYELSLQSEKIRYSMVFSMYKYYQNGFIIINHTNNFWVGARTIYRFAPGSEY